MWGLVPLDAVGVVAEAFSERERLPYAALGLVESRCADDGRTYEPVVAEKLDAEVGQACSTHFAIICEDGISFCLLVEHRQHRSHSSHVSQTCWRVL